MAAAQSPLPAFLLVGCAGGRGLLKAGRRGCVLAEGSVCRWSRSQSWEHPEPELGSSYQEVKVVLIQEEALLQPESPGTCAHSQLHLHCLHPPDLQSQSQSQSWSAPASQRRSL